MNDKIKFVIVLLIATLIGFFGGVFYPSNSNVDKTHKEIHLIYKERIAIKDSIIKVQGKIQTQYITDTQYIDSSFKNSNDSDKIALFNLHYPKVDTHNLMIISESQAKSAILEQITRKKDSAMYVEEKKSRENCDSSLTKVVTKTDTLVKEVKNESKKSFWTGFGIGFVTGFVTNTFAERYIESK